ncbi:hypothetical protein [Paenibacillus apiarius]|uniref:hypothetical protein n=1 Tax=Paenibacillus apiarius TaxID=46240 RepID=UPI00198068E9|nr:hypothetical protein [Paenibacillus apiarius]MBN3524074.1 hypothetical protein [Paenibacillus apiarius]
MKQDTQYNWITTAIFLTILTVTVALFFTFSEIDTRDLSWWLSLGSLVLAELLSYLFSFKLLKGGPEFKAAVPAYLSLGTVLFFYDLAVLIHIVLFWIILDVSAQAYLWIQLLTFAVALVIALLLGLSKVFVGRLVTDERMRLQSMKQLQLVVHGARLELEGWEHAERETMLELLRKLEEQVKYSDPVSLPAMVLEEAQLMEKANRLEAGVRSAVRERHTLYSAEELRGMIQDLSNAIRLRNEQLTILK